MTLIIDIFYFLSLSSPLSLIKVCLPLVLFNFSSTFAPPFFLSSAKYYFHVLSPSSFQFLLFYDFFNYSSTSFSSLEQPYFSYFPLSPLPFQFAAFLNGFCSFWLESSGLICQLLSLVSCWLYNFGQKIGHNSNKMANGFNLTTTYTHTNTLATHTYKVIFK